MSLLFVLSIVILLVINYNSASGLFTTLQMCAARYRAVPYIITATFAFGIISSNYCLFLKPWLTEKPFRLKNKPIDNGLMPKLLQALTVNRKTSLSRSSFCCRGQALVYVAMAPQRYKTWYKTRTPYPCCNTDSVYITVQWIFLVVWIIVYAVMVFIVSYMHDKCPQVL